MRVLFKNLKKPEKSDLIRNATHELAFNILSKFQVTFLLFHPGFSQSYQTKRVICFKQQKNKVNQMRPRPMR